MKLASVLLFIFVFVKCTHQESPGGIKPKSVLQGLSAREQSVLQHITHGIQQFYYRVIPSIVKESDYGLICPHVSLYSNLFLMYMGAGGATEKELFKLLSLSTVDDETARLGHKSLTRVLEDSDSNFDFRIFVDQSVPVNPVFSFFFGAWVKSVNFKNTAEVVRENINSWLEKSTNGTIRDLVLFGTVFDKTRLVLVNYLHYKGSWQTKFDKSLTSEQPFFVTSKEQRPVQMMNIKGSFHFYHDNDHKFKILGLDYTDDGMKMFVVLPDNNVSLFDLQQMSKTMNSFEKLNKTLTTEVDVYLPRFKLETTAELSLYLKNLGARTMFSESANFSYISDERLVVSNVFQKAVIKVNEDGSDTTSSGSVNMIDTPKSENNLFGETFKADHPFLFFIAKGLDIPIMIGIYSGPE